MKICLFLVLVLTLVPQIVFARPEYALREKALCLNCHVNPFGAGHRNNFGKMYGSRKIGQPLTNEYKNFYADFRMIYKRNEGNILEGSNSNGFALMSSEVSGMVNVTEEETGFSTSAVASTDLGSLGTGPRNAYVLFTNTDKKALVHTVLVGKSYIPFGLMIDDHRSYLRQQTNTRYNRDFEMGASFSGTPLWNIHYDLSVFNGYQNDKFNSGDETLGGNLNLHWNPEELPFMLGASQVIHYSRARTNGPSPRALSLYGILDLREPTEDAVPVSFLAEVVLADHFNTPNGKSISNFVNSNTHENYLAAIQNSTSRGISAQVKWDINKQWQLALKHEQLLLDKRFQGDIYHRNEAMVNYQFTGNSSIMAVFDKNDAKKPGINQNGTLYADTDSYLVLFRTWL